MNSDDKDNSDPSEQDAFYHADYDDDTIDYDLDTDKLLEEELFEPPLTTPWEDEELQDTPGDQQPVRGNPEQAYGESLELQGEAEEVWYDDDSPDVNYAEAWPLGLIAAAVIALLLLGAGGYGVIQQRTAMQAEIRQLQAALSTTASNTEVAASRQAQRALEARNAELQSRIDALQQEVQSLNQAQDKLGSPAAAPPVVTGEQNNTGIAAAAKVPPDVAVTVEKTTPSPKTSTPWFVNFGSYTQEADARTWVTKLQADEGKIVVVSGNKDGRQYFRVRVVDLPNREIAEKIARQLEHTHNLPRLWIGKQ